MAGSKAVSYDINGQPIYNQQLWSSPDEFQQAVMADSQKKTATLTDKDIDISKPGHSTLWQNMVNYIPAAGAAVGEAVAPEATPFSGMAGASGGNLIKQALQRYAPSTFGTPPANPLGDLTVDTAIGGVPGALRGLKSPGVLAEALKDTGSWGKSIGSALQSAIGTKAGISSDALRVALIRALQPFRGPVNAVTENKMLP